MVNKVTTVTSASFDNGYGTLRVGPIRELDTLAAWLKTNDLQYISIEGFTADDQAHDYNLDLSKRRADAVRDYLVGRGIPALFGNDTAIGRDRNRRVEVRLNLR